MTINPSEYKPLIVSSLEDCRLETTRLLRTADRPTTIRILRLVVDERDGGWESSWENVLVSSLTHVNNLLAISDESILGMLCPDLREQLLPLANLLVDVTDLNTRRFAFYTSATGIDAILNQYLYPVAIHYMISLTDIASPSIEIASEIADEFVTFIEMDSLRTITQFSVAGIRTNQNLIYRGVSIRPLTRYERGAYAEKKYASGSDLNLRGEFSPPTMFTGLMPSTLIECDETSGFNQSNDKSFANQLALAFFLRGHVISSDGISKTFDFPLWASKAHRILQFPVFEKALFAEENVADQELIEVVDFAHSIGPFGAQQSSTHEVSLFSALRGFGANFNGSGFLDLVVALEAALLSDSSQELSHRFSLFGALFLKDDFPAIETFASLRNIYNIRSDLVHGNPIDKAKRLEAEQDASKLALALFKRSLEYGWPDQKILTAFALRSD